MSGSGRGGRAPGALGLLLLAVAACSSPREPVAPPATSSPSSVGSASPRPAATATRSNIGFAVVSTTPGRTRSRRLFALEGAVLVGTFRSLELLDGGGLRADEPLRLALSDDAELLGVVGRHPESVFLHVREVRCHTCKTRIRRVTPSRVADVLSSPVSAPLCGLARVGARVVALAPGAPSAAPTDRRGELTVLEGPPLPAAEGFGKALGWRRCHLAGLVDGTLVAVGELLATGEVALAVLDAGSSSARTVPLGVPMGEGAVGLLPLLDGAVVQHESPPGSRRIVSTLFDGKRITPLELPRADAGVVAAGGTAAGALFVVVDTGQGSPALLHRASAAAPFLPVELPASSAADGPTDVLVTEAGQVWVTTPERVLLAR